MCGFVCGFCLTLGLSGWVTCGSLFVRLNKLCLAWGLSFYCLNTSYPMDNCFTGRRDRSRQTPEKDVLYIIPTGPVSSVHSLGGASYLLPVQTE